MLLRYEDAKFYESGGIAVDRSFFDMLTFPFKKGDMATALNDPNSIVLNESIAEKLFGDIDPIGKILKVNNRYDLMVTGVFQDVKMNSTYQFSFVLPWEYMKNHEWFQEDRWDNHNHPTFVLLQENTQVVELEKKIKNIFDEHNGEFALKVEISLQSFPDMCFYTEINGMTGMDSGLIFGFLALFILLISCINFMNLTTARSAFRYKEIGIRKVVGCSRRNIIIQFFSESLMLSFISLIVAIILIEPSLMIINSKMGMDLTLNFVSNWGMLVAMLGIAFVTGIISGSYPAFYLSSFSPLNIIKGTFNSGKRKPVMRRLLVSVQLGLTIIFLITGFVSSRQFDFLMNHDMGWERENLIYIRMRGDSEKSIGILKNELVKIPGVNKVSAGYCLPYTHYSSTTGIKWPDKNPEEKISLRYNFVDPEYMDILNLEMVEGKSFSKELMNESSSYVINETLARIIGIEPIIGTEIEFWGNPGRIIGVVKDFHTRSLKTEITPMIMMIRNYDAMNYTLIKLNPENTSETMADISETWKTILPEYPIEYGFIEDDLYNMYNDEGAMGIMMKGITIFTLIITCLGLMALVAFMTEKRKKEIGVRKVLGSSIPAIIKLISREFFTLLTVSNVLACLAAYFLMKAFLGTYAYRTEIVWNEFILSCFLISAVAMLTISYQTFKAARANPVDTLRWE